MTTTKTTIPLRDARDRLIDLLGAAMAGFGQTYPLQDLPIPSEQLTVAFDTPAKIRIECSQKNTLYQLHDLDGNVVEKTAANEPGSGEPIEAEGNGATLILETYKIGDNDVTFQIYAQKQPPNTRQHAAYLTAVAPVKAGLNLTLEAEIVNLPLLNPTQINPPKTAVRLADYGSPVQVQIHNSQEGVSYRLVTYENGVDTAVLSTADIVGDLGTITLTTLPVQEDIIIQIRATKSSPSSTKTRLLTTALPLSVRANPSLVATITPDPIIDYQATASLTLAQTQTSVRYQLYQRTVPDADIHHRPHPDHHYLRVTVPDQPDPLHLLHPTLGYPWELPSGYQPIGIPQQGTGTDLVLPLPPLTHETIFVIEAQKQHLADPAAANSQLIPTSVPLEQATAVLVRPNPTPDLALKTEFVNDPIISQLEFSGGQPGIFYHVKLAANADAIEPAAYFHQHDAANSHENKGVNQLTIGVDFVVQRPFPTTTSPTNPVTIQPLPPQIDLDPPIPAGSTLHLEAKKAMTHVHAPLAQTVIIPTPPTIQLQVPVLDYNGETKIEVLASHVDDKYRVFLYGEPFKQPRNGNGNSITFNTDPLQIDTEFEMHITPQNGSGIPVTRIVKLLAQVRPDPTLAVTAATDIVEAGEQTTVFVANSQPDVNYQLMVGETVVGQPHPGTGSNLSLPTEPLTATTTFAIRASKANNPAIVVQLTATITITVHGNGN